MLLFRLILLVAIVLIAYRLYRLVMAPRVPKDTEKPKLKGEDMVQCALCELHVPRAKALEQRGRWYCCDDHRRQHADAPEQD